MENDEKTSLSTERTSYETLPNTSAITATNPTKNYGTIDVVVGPSATTKGGKKSNGDGSSSATGSESDLSDKSTSHCHESVVRNTDSNARARKTLIIASGLCLFFMIVEVVGGAVAHSLAIMTDAAHLLSDFASFMISLVSLYLATRPATRRMSFGWHRAEVIGAVVSVLMIWVLTGILVFVAIQRIIYKNYEVRGDVMLITASVGVAVNLVMAIVLHRGGHGHSHGGGGGMSHSHSHSHGQENVEERGTFDEDAGATMTASATEALIDQSFGRTGGNWLEIGTTSSTTTTGNGRYDHERTRGLARYLPWKKAPRGRQQPDRQHAANINVRAALVHVIGDFVQSIGILIAALIIYFRPDLTVMDPICTFIFSVLVLITTITVMRDALNVLMEGLPRGINFTEVVVCLRSIPGVIKVHDLRIWSLTMDKVALSVHLAVDQRQNAQDILRQATQVLRERFRVYECTVQIEHYSDAMNDCKSCETPEK